MTFNHIGTLDALTVSNQEIDKARDPEKPFNETREDILGFTFQPGQRVLDLVTRKEVTILDGQRADYITQRDAAKGDK